MTNYEALGRIVEWAQQKGLSGNAFSVYMTIVRRTIGYRQYTSEITSYGYISKLSKVSLRTVGRIMPKLIEDGYIIKVATNNVANTGKVAYKYQLNMKLKDFPHLGALRTGKGFKSIEEIENSLPPLSDKPMQDEIIARHRKIQSIAKLHNLI